MTAHEHNRLIGIFFLAYSGLQLFFLLIGVAFMMMFGGLIAVESNVKDTAPLAFMAVFIGIAFVISLALLIPTLVGGWKIFKQKPGAKTWGIIASIVALLNFPLGMAIGIYGLWFLFGEHGQALYNGNVNNTARFNPPPPNNWQ